MTRTFEYEPGDAVQGTTYRVVKLVGAGGMGAVYEVEDVTVGRRFVMKTLHAELRDRPDFVRRMEKEARILARLNHPNIVQVFTAGVTADAHRIPYYVMERLEGQTLRGLIDAKGALPLHAAYTIGIELLDALDRAHETGVIHRDVKPENIIIHRNGDGTATTKLLDFGIMSLMDGDGDNGRTRFMGTLRYAAPEQARGDDVTPLSDLYAAALVLYEMIAGRSPWEDIDGIHALIHAQCNVEPPPLSAYAQLPVDLENAIHRALQKDPADRPPDAHTFAGALRRLKRASRDAIPEVATAGDTAGEGFVLALTAPTPPPPGVTPAPRSAARATTPAVAAARQASRPSDALALPATGAVAGLGLLRRRGSLFVVAIVAGAVGLTVFGLVAALALRGKGSNTPSALSSGASAAREQAPATAPMASGASDASSRVPPASPPADSEASPSGSSAASSASQDQSGDRRTPATKHPSPASGVTKPLRPAKPMPEPVLEPEFSKPKRPGSGI